MRFVARSQSEEPAPPDASAIADSYPVEPEAFAALLDGTNISKATFLATDYLNNFNELVMLFGLLADMPEMLDEIKEWQGLSYVEHFEQSGFPFGELAIAGWHRADPSRRAALNQFVDVAAGMVMTRVAELEAFHANGDTESFGAVCNDARRALMAAHEWAVGLIHGLDVVGANEIDALLGIRQAG